jgi:hypothetical protein
MHGGGNAHSILLLQQHDSKCCGSLVIMAVVYFCQVQSSRAQPLHPTHLTLFDMCNTQTHAVIDIT